MASAAFSLILFLFAVLLSSAGGEQNLEVAGAFSLLGLMVSVFSFFAGVRSFRETDTKPVLGIAGTLFGGLVMLGYFTILFAGLK